MRKQGKRTRRGFTHAGGLIAPQLRKASEKKGFAHSRLLTDWAEVVGEDIAALARPLNVSYARQGFGATLSVLVEGAAAPQVQMMIPTIIERVNACYGYSAISRVTLTQTAPTGFAEGRTPFQHKTAKRLDDAELSALRSEVGEVGDEGLRAALLSLGTNVKASAKR
ncbi:DUF721 domain-containing protein [Pontivivens ytuae]|uniref:DUF721 domain-containing protein n=1 Tax=Pontivivens ytuae TaxID=2789856 RepID=A0A7S9QEC6_9RHOB|nr:DciA family protein [Pontivivens ytuae]QPH55928.1 DUF721 domain-containing protein [Pontivivens ytuae]